MEKSRFNRSRASTYIVSTGILLLNIIFAILLFSGLDKIGKINHKITEIQDSVKTISKNNGIKATDNRVDNSSSNPQLLAELEELNKKLDTLDIKIAQVQTTTAVEQSLKFPPVLKQEDLRISPLIPLPKEDYYNSNNQAKSQRQSDVSTRSKELFKEIIEKYAVISRQRIEAETDPNYPDPKVIRRIMEEAQDNIANDLINLLPPEDYDALYGRD